MCNRIEDCVLGFATADAMGVPIEFTRRNLNNPLTEMVGYGSHPVPEGTWSDDTSMMLAEMCSIVEEKGINFEKIMENFVQWVKKAKFTATDELFDIGISTRNAIFNYANRNLPPKECGMSGIRDNGNGSLMRILPFVIYAYSNNMSEEEVVNLINDASSLTHAHEISKLGCKIYCDYMFELLNNQTKEEAFEALSTIDYSRYYSEESIEYYKRILDGTLKNASITEIKSSGIVVDTLEAALWVTLKTDSYEKAVVLSINLGDDTDTVGAITGSINGLIYGKNEIPNRWLDKLRKKEVLINESKKFNDLLNLDMCKKK